MEITPPRTPLKLGGADFYQGLLPKSQQTLIINELRNIIRQAPLFTPHTPSGRPMSVRMSAAGKYGWITDQRGYRYDELHPNGSSWPEIPESILDVWQTVAPKARVPECCLINFYGESARMGMHQDNDESDPDQPVVSISLGDDGLFRIGSSVRGGKTGSVWLKSGDVIVLGGRARLAHHGVDRIRFQSSTLLPKGGRVNLTLRVVT
jgi:DNA oxidative demethylase